MLLQFLRKLSAIGACGIIALTATAAQAQDKALEFLHTPLSAEGLAPAGTPLQLKLALGNTRELSTTLQTFVSLDGRLLELPLQQAVLDEKDRPSFTIEFSAPVAEVTYQFIVRRKDGSAVVSPRYASRRTCLPELSLSEESLEKIQLDDPSQSEDNVSAAELVGFSRALKRENENLEQATALANSIKVALSEL